MKAWVSKHLDLRGVDRAEALYDDLTAADFEWTQYFHRPPWTQFRDMQRYRWVVARFGDYGILWSPLTADWLLRTEGCRPGENKDDCWIRRLREAFG